MCQNENKSRMVSWKSSKYKRKQDKFVFVCLQTDFQWSLSWQLLDSKHLLAKISNSKEEKPFLATKKIPARVWFIWKSSQRILHNLLHVRVIVRKSRIIRTTSLMITKLSSGLRWWEKNIHKVFKSSLRGGSGTIANFLFNEIFHYDSSCCCKNCISFSLITCFVIH